MLCFWRWMMLSMDEQCICNVVSWGGEGDIVNHWSCLLLQLCRCINMLCWTLPPHPNGQYKCQSLNSQNNQPFNPFDIQLCLVDSIWVFLQGFSKRCSIYFPQRNVLVYYKDDAILLLLLLRNMCIFLHKSRVRAEQTKKFGHVEENCDLMQQWCGSGLGYKKSAKVSRVLPLLSQIAS